LRVELFLIARRYSYGVHGIANEDFVDLSAETRANLEAIAATPSSALGSTRDKPDMADCQAILEGSAIFALPATLRENKAGKHD
jgi:hypothetical protein